MAITIRLHGVVLKKSRKPVAHDRVGRYANKQTILIFHHSFPIFYEKTLFNREYMKRGFFIEQTKSIGFANHGSCPKCKLATYVLFVKCYMRFVMIFNHLESEH